VSYKSCFLIRQCLDWQLFFAKIAKSFNSIGVPHNASTLPLTHKAGLHIVWPQKMISESLDLKAYQEDADNFIITKYAIIESLL
jgi:hypothetical protein